MKKSIKYLCSIVAICMLTLCFTACGKDPSIELFVSGSDEEKVYEVAPGDTLQFDVNVENLDEDTVTYLVTDGHATITQTGLLTVDEDAIVKSTISVQAESGDVKSNKITLNVIDLKPTTIDLVTVGNRTKIAKGGNVVFDVEYNPTYSTIKDYTLSITQGGDFAELDATTKTLTIKNTAVEEDIVGETIKVKATLNKDTSIADEFEVTVVAAGSVHSITAENKTVNTSTSATQYVAVSAYNEAGDMLSDDQDYTYTTNKPEVATIEQATGRIIPHGHGTAEITISTASGKTTKCNVNVIVAPEKIALNNVSSHILDGKVMSYSKVDLLDLDIEMTHTNLTCTDKVKYEFELLDDNLETIASGDQVAVVKDGGIEFKTTGRVLVTISSDSKIGTTNTSKIEKTTQLTVLVNDGFNADSIADLKAYADRANDGKICNITKDINLTASDNFGVESSDHKYSSLIMYGDRVINGNGYVISAENLPKTEATGSGNEFLKFEHNGRPFNVAINDLTLVGNTNVNGTLANTSESVLRVEDDDLSKVSFGFYRRGILVNGERAENVYNQDTPAAKNYAVTQMNNVNVSGFDVGIRLVHVVDSILSNCEVSNCFSNGIESVQNIIEFNNMTLGQVGAFGIEISSDDMLGMLSPNPTGTAGKNYDQTSKVTMTGSIVSENLSNGVSTTYMAENYAAIPQIAQGLISAMVNMLPAELQPTMQSVAEDCMFNNSTDKMMNLYLLIFVNPQELPNYVEKGNTEGKFAEYGSDSSVGSAINMKDVLMGIITEGANYDDYKNYKYIILDLEGVPGEFIHEILTGMELNVGQVVLVNQAYEA